MMSDTKVVPIVGLEIGILCREFTCSLNLLVV